MGLWEFPEYRYSTEDLRQVLFHLEEIRRILGDDVSYLDDEAEFEIRAELDRRETGDD